MFKRILKVVGLVLLGFVLLIGGVVGFMAIRGDFKKQVIKPTSINFSIEKTDLILDATISDNPTLGNGRVHSFTIKAEPLDTNVTECTLKLSAPLITFVKWETDKWVENATSTFHLNTPIYFVVNNVVDKLTGKGFELEEDDYYDGVLTITVKDKSGLLQDTLELEIDRNITSISFKDQYKSVNNRIINGLFDYELQEGYDDSQKLEAIQREDYPLEIITAPLKASKPFSSGARENAKISEMYYVKDGQPRLVVHDEGVVKLQRYNDQGGIVEDICDFLTYDTTNDRYIFNSQESGDFEFLLATYPTYDVQERVLAQNMSFIERLQSKEENDTFSMLTKKVVITVNGTEADHVEFGGDEGSISLNLLQDNKWIANNPSTLDKYDLGLTMSKSDSGTGINSRYNELKFLTENDFADGITWTFKRKEDRNGEFEDTGERVTITFVKNVADNIKATITGLDGYVNNTVDYDVELIKNAEGYALTLIYINPENNEDYAMITFTLSADDDTGRTLTLVEDGNELSQAIIQKSGAENATTIHLDLQVGNCLLLGDVVKERDGETVYNFKTLKPGVYLALLGKYAEDTSLKLINDKFITAISHNGADTEITVKPVDADIQNVKLYAIVVNSNGTYHYTSNYREIVINTIHSSIQILDDELNVPVVVGESVVYDSIQFNAQGNGGLFTVSGGSYTQGVLFTPRYTRLDMDKAPQEWGNGLEVYTRSGDTYTKVDKIEEYISKTYYIKNNFKTIDLISYTQNEMTYYLVGYIENNSFVNKVVPTSDGPNHYAKLYPAVVKSKYLIDEGRLQTAEEVVNEILTGKQGTSPLLDGSSTLTYDLSLLPNRKITNASTLYYIKTTDSVYDSKKTYYELVDGIYVEKQITATEVIDWLSIKENCFELLALDICPAQEMFGEPFETNDAGWVYYTKNTDQITLEKVTEYSQDNWANYYIVIDHYLIIESNEVDENIEIDACPYSKTVNGQYNKLDITKTFTITKANYQSQIGTKFNISIPKFSIDDFIMVNSYYAFSSENSVKPQVSFGGTYFDNEQTKADDFYTIIAGHKNIGVDWNGITPIESTDSIGEQVAKTSITIAHKEKGSEILNNIVRDLRINAIEYNANGSYVGVFTSIEIGQIDLDYIPAGAEYNENITYYILQGDEYVVLEIDDEVKGKWADNYTEYYIYGISATFNVTGMITGNNYIKLEWVYTGGNGEYKIYSPELRILSSQLTKYNIDISESINNIENIYTISATKVDKNAGENPEDGIVVDLYKYVHGNYERIDQQYDGDCYSLEIVKFNIATSNINYQLYVDYNNGYVYTIYVVDDNNNYLYYLDEGTGKYTTITTDVDTAFKLKSQGGWIAPNPVYAQQADFAIQDNNNIRLQRVQDGESAGVSVVSALVSQGFTSVILKSNDGAIQTSIKVQVVADSKFAYNQPGSVESAGLQLANGNMFKYNNTTIDALMQASIDSFSIIRNGEVVTDKYAISNDEMQIVLKTDGKVLAELKWNSGTNQWQLSRTTYDDIVVSIEFKTILGYEYAEFKFTSPYKIIKSATNNTGVIYSGTKFILAQNQVSDNISQAEDSQTVLDTLFKFVKVSEGVITIKHDLMASGESAITTGENSNTYEFVVPTVTQSTNCNFVIYFNDGQTDGRDIQIGSFGLTIKPNILINANIDGLIKLNDFTNNIYKFKDLEISSYSIKDDQNNEVKYCSYTLDVDKNGVFDGLVEATNLNLNYKVTTFTDNKFENKHTVNIASIVDDELQVAPISTLGTYYINVIVDNAEINNGKTEFVNVGEINFIVESVSKVVSSSNGEISALMATAKTSEEYSISNLQTIFNLSQNQSVTNIKLSDILWISNNNEHLNITYNYEGGTLTQNLNTLTYEGVTYTLIGTTLNMDGYIFDISDNCIRTSKGEELPTQMFGKNIAYYMYKGASVIYCKQNTYLFENGNEILAMSIEDDGKTLYKFAKQTNDSYFTPIESADNPSMCFKKVTDNEYTLISSGEQVVTRYKLNTEPTGIGLGEFQSLQLFYNSFGNNIAPDAEIIDVINYKADLVFDYANAKYTVVNNESYDINIYPIKLLRNEYAVLSEYLAEDTKYKLYGEYTSENPPLFKANTNVKSVVFGAGNSYTIENREYIKFKSNGNNYIVSLPVTLTYTDNTTTYTYYVDILVVNSTVVDIKYPYNITKQEDETKYNVFNASITELSNSVDGLYDVKDFVKWLGVDQSTTDWQSSARFAYDLALRSDVINLAEANDLHNTKRYNVYRYEQIHNSFKAVAGTTYYSYNQQTGGFEKADLTIDSSYDANKYFIRVNSNETISKIEVVATSSTYAIDANIVKSWFTCNENAIMVKSPADKAEDETLNLTGYVAFKIYAGDTGAYGYYLLKVVADEQFDRVIGFGEARNSQTISYKLSNSGETLKDIFDDPDTSKIYSVADISSDLIDYENYSNVYLFKVSSNNAQGAISNDNITNGQYVPFDTELTYTTSIQTITLAVVVRSGTSLVHVCNYEIVLQPNIEVDIKSAYTESIEEIDYSRYEYLLNDALRYVYNSNNITDLAQYFTVKEGNQEIDLTDVVFVDADCLNIAEDNKSIKDGDTIIATLTDDNELEWSKNISQQATIRLKLTHANTYDIYLTIILAPFKFEATNELPVGGMDNVNNSLELTKIFGNYEGGYKYTITDSSGSIVEEVTTSTNSVMNGSTTDATTETGSKIVKFPQTYNESATYYIAITLTDVYSHLPSNTIVVKVLPNINFQYNSNRYGESADKPINPTINTELTEAGSMLGVNIDTSYGITTITLGEDKNNPLFTINAKGSCSVKFSLTDSNGNELKLGGNSYKYFVDETGALASDITLSSESDRMLKFVHSASDINAILNITIIDGANIYATTYALYITIPKTYELSSIYRVDGATFETVVTNTELILKANDNNKSIDNHFFGDDTPIYIKATEYLADKVYYTYDGSVYTRVETPQESDIDTYYEKFEVDKLNKSRIAITFKGDGKDYYGYDNIKLLGLFDSNNPNKLSYSLIIDEETNNSEINTDGILTFASNDNGKLTTLNVSNNTSVSISYDFKVFSAESDYSNIEYNNNL